MDTAGLHQLRIEDLETLVRRLVREELAVFFKTAVRSADETGHPKEIQRSADDDLALREALAVLNEHGQNPAAWMAWADFETELARAEAAGELPD